MSYPHQRSSVLTPEATELAGKVTGMVLIKAGYFQMGSYDGAEAERPVREMYLEDFWMEEALVTNRRFAGFVRATGYQTDAERIGSAWGYRNGQYSLINGLNWRSYAVPGRDDHPVVLVSWFDAMAFAEWAGRGLPTEAQWEKAARGGLNDQLYPWGGQAPNETLCSFAGRPSEMPCTTEIKSFSPNGHGLYDMVGNVWQWCADRYAPYGEETDSMESDSTGAGALYVRRGGAWNVIQSFRLRCSNRGALEARAAVPNVGFRCVSKEATL